MKLTFNEDFLNSIVTWDQEEFIVLVSVSFKDFRNIAKTPSLLINYDIETDKFTFGLYEGDEMEAYKSEYVPHTSEKEYIEEMVRELVKQKKSPSCNSVTCDIA